VAGGDDTTRPRLEGNICWFFIKHELPTDFVNNDVRLLCTWKIEIIGLVSNLEFGKHRQKLKSKHWSLHIDVIGKVGYDSIVAAEVLPFQDRSGTDSMNHQQS
jgi:hypothetical protein